MTLHGGYVSSLDSAPSLLRGVEQAIQESLPTGFQQRHKLLIRFARKLKGIASLADAPAKALKPIVKQWHERALPNIGTKPFDETWFDFAEGWGKVKFPAGEGPLATIFQRAAKVELPAVATQYEQADLRLLVALCRELQRVSGDGPFFLSVRTAGRAVIGTWAICDTSDLRILDNWQLIAIIGCMAGKGKRRATFSEQIRRAIEQSGLTRYEIAKRTGIQQSALSRFMSSERGLSTLTVDKLAELLGLEVVKRDLER